MKSLVDVSKVYHWSASCLDCLLPLRLRQKGASRLGAANEHVARATHAGHVLALD